MSPLNQGIIKVPPEISDHSATYVHVPFEYHLNGTFTRNVWMYKYANHKLLNKIILSLIGHVFMKVLLVKLVYYLQMFFIEFAKLCIPNKTIVVREDDKPWYDSEIRRNSRKRYRLKKTALKTGNTNDWKKYKMFRNKVNNKKNMGRNLLLQFGYHHFRFSK